MVFLNCRQIDAPAAPYINPTGFIEEFDERRKIKSHQLLRFYADQLKSANVRTIPKNDLFLEL